MNPELIPQEIATAILLELLFGLGYNVVVAWVHRHRLMHVSHSVVVGVSGTLLIPALIWFDRSLPFWKSGLLIMCCFAASGAPMVIGSMRRTVRDDKKRRRIGNTAGRIRDEIVMEIAAMAHEIADMTRTNTLTINHLPDIVNRLHGLIGALKSL